MLNKKSTLYKTLARALSMKRPHGTRSVEEFTDWLADHVPTNLKLHRSYDGVGNLHIDARVDDTSRTLFVAHVDTVHRDSGPNKIRKTQGMWYADGACLGADDGAGCAILMHLMAAHVPGYYIFTQGEERGGIGAKYLAEHSPELLGQFDRAIAFDRRGIDSVITHQGYGRCCSDEFAAALSGELCADGVLMYLGDDTGVYTDTAEFTDIIPECTNISVGYDKEHSDKETLDIHHFTALAAAVVKIKWDALPTDRDPKARETAPALDSWKTVYSTTTWDSTWKDDIDRMQYAEYTDEDWLEDALHDAQRGMYNDLLELIADTAYPEDPALARRFMSKKRLTDEVLADALEQCLVSGATSALLGLFDAAYSEA
jgi:hypothetical protein